MTTYIILLMIFLFQVPKKSRQPLLRKAAGACDCDCEGGDVGRSTDVDGSTSAVAGTDEFFISSADASSTEHPHSTRDDHSAHALDHMYACTMSPSKLKRKLDDVNGQLRKKLKTSLQTSRRLRKRMTSLAEVVESLKNKKRISNGCTDRLES